MSVDAGYHYDYVVIGGGIYALSYALALARGGLRVAVFEKNPSLGGVLAPVKVGEDTLDMGCIVAGSIEKGTAGGSALDALGLRGALRLKSPNGVYSIMTSEHTFDLSKDFGRNAAMVSSIFHEDSPGMEHFLGAIHSKMKKAWVPFQSEGNFSLMMRKVLKGAQGAAMHLMQSRQTLGSYLDCKFNNNYLQSMLLASFAHCGDDPYQFLVKNYIAMQANLFAGIHCIDGGITAFCGHMQAELSRLGCDIFTECEVVKINRDPAKAVIGSLIVKDKSGNKSEVSCKGALASCSLYHVVYNLLEASPISAVRNLITRHSSGVTATVLTLRLSRPLSSLGWHRFLTFIRPSAASFQTYKAKSYIYSNYHERPISVIDFSQLGADQVTECNIDAQQMSVIVNIPDKYEGWSKLTEEEAHSKVEDLKALITLRLDAFIPGIKDSIIGIHTQTPVDIMHKSNGYKGSLYGFNKKVHHKSISFEVMRQAIGIKNIRFAPNVSYFDGSFLEILKTGYADGLTARKKSRRFK